MGTRSFSVNAVSCASLQWQITLYRRWVFVISKYPAEQTMCTFGSSIIKNIISISSNRRAYGRRFMIGSYLKFANSNLCPNRPSCCADGKHHSNTYSQSSAAHSGEHHYRISGLMLQIQATLNEDRSTAHIH